MTVFLSNPDYSPIKGYAELQGDWSSANSTIYITEARIQKIDNGYVFYIVANSITDLWKAETFKDGTQICFIAHTKEYTRYTKENPKLPTQPTLLEKTIANWLESDGSIWLDKSFNGVMNLNGSEGFLNSIIAAKAWQILFAFTECQPSLIKEFPQENSNSNKRSGGSYQSELQRLENRQSFLIRESSSYGEKANNMTELAFGLSGFKKECPDAYEVFLDLMQLMLGR